MNFRQRQWFRGITGLMGVSLVLAALWPSRVMADEPAITSLLGDDVGLCLEVRDLRQHIREVPATEWFRRLTELSLVKRWQQGPEFTRLQASQTGLAILFGQPIDQFVSELFGESVVLAISPATSGPPTGVLLSRAAKDDTWDRVLALWDQLEAHDVQTKSVFGRSFQVRRKKSSGPEAGPDIFTAKLGRTLAISTSESLIHDILARSAATNVERSKPLDQSPTFRQAMSSLPDNAAIRLFVDPRRWDTELAKDSAAASQLMPLWKKLEWISAGLEIRDGVIFHAVVHHDTQNLPVLWQQAVAVAAAREDLAARLPAESVVAGEARIPPSICRWLRTLDPSEKSQRDWQTFDKVTRGMLGRDLFDDVLSHSGPSLGGAIVPKTPVEEKSAPIDGLFAWQFDFSGERAGDDTHPMLRESLDGALLTLINLGAVAHNSRNPDQPATLRVQHRESQTIRWLDQLPPFQPAFSVTDKHVLLATSPRLVAEFQDRAAGGSALSSEPLFAEARSRHFAEHSQWLFVNVRRGREFLTEQHEPLSRQIGHWRKSAAPSVAIQLDRLRELLTPFDAAFVAGKMTPGEVRLTSGLLTAAPKP